MANANDKLITCPTCGHRREGAEADPSLHATVERVVRKGHRYGAVKGGGSVLVEARHAAHPSIVAATMSADEALAELAAVEAKAAAKASPPPGRLKERVALAFAASRAGVLAQIERNRAAAAERAADAPPAAPPAQVSASAAG